MATPEAAPLYVGPSRREHDWMVALMGADDQFLKQLADEDQPGAALFTLATYVNGMYMPVDAGLMELDDVRSQIERVIPVADGIRRRLGWRQCEVDLELMRWIRRSGCLSICLGAGATMAANGPSWPELVRLLVERALERGHEVARMAATSVTGQPPRLDGDTVIFEESGSIEARREVVRVQRLDPRTEAVARTVLAAIARYGAAADAELLTAGAQLCSDLWGQELFQHMTGILYGSCEAPGPTHRAVARVAREESKSGGPGAGWESIVTYNFDSLMEEALANDGVPHAAWAMSGGQMCGDPDRLAQESSWHVPVYHLHGYTPRRPFLITASEFVFSTNQYAERYGRDYDGVLRLVLDRYLSRPIHATLYVGCSFADAEMNELLRRAGERFPGRRNFALVPWPAPLHDAIPGSDEVEERSRKYLGFGVQPVWFQDFSELPSMIASLR